MKRFFPLMYDRPNGGHIFCSFVYWMFCFVIFPFIIPILIPGFYQNTNLLTWIELIYYVINALCLILMYREYLTDSFSYQVQDNLASFFETVASAVGLMLIAAVILTIIGIAFLWNPLVLVGGLPIVENSVTILADMMTMVNPLFSTLCFSLLTPFTVTILFYAPAFAPICCERPWLAYLIVPIVLALPCAFNIFWRDQADIFLYMYALRLPFHMIACWSYQKANTIWAPIASLGIFNLISCFGIIFLEHIGWISL